MRGIVSFWYYDVWLENESCKASFLRLDVISTSRIVVCLNFEMSTLA